MRTAWHVDQAILAEDERLVLIRFGRTGSRACLAMDAVLADVAPLVARFCAVYTCDTAAVADFNEMYELFGELHCMLFWQNRHIQVDVGSGQNNNIDFVVRDSEDVVAILELAYMAAKKGQGLVLAHRDFSKERQSQIKYGL